MIQCHNYEKVSRNLLILILFEQIKLHPLDTKNCILKRLTNYLINISSILIWNTTMSLFKYLQI